MANELKPWKCGNEFLPYHPQASHCAPDYRAGWNDCFAEAQTQISALEAKLATERRKRQEEELMAGCMDMVWQDLINLGVIDKTVPPMMLTEGVCAALRREVAAENEACQQIAQDFKSKHYRIANAIQSAIRSRTPKETGADLSGAERKTP